VVRDEDDKFMEGPANILRLVLNLDAWDGPDYPMSLIGYMGRLGPQLLHVGLSTVMSQLDEDSSTVRMSDVEELRDRGLINLADGKRSGEYNITVPYRVRAITKGRLNEIPDLEYLTQVLEGRNNAGPLGPVPAPSLQITGQNIAISTGSGDIHQRNTDNVQTLTIRQGSDEDLRNALEAIGLGSEDILDLKEAARADQEEAGRPSFGQRLRDRLSEMAVRVVEAQVVKLVGEYAVPAALWLVIRIVALWLGLPMI
jgi:hypothetical protein